MTDIPAIIRESSALIVSLTGLLIALVSVITSVRANQKTDKKVEETKAAIVEQAATVEKVEAKAVVAEAQVARVVEDAAATREQTRKMHQFITTDVFNANVLAEALRTDFSLLEPVSRPGELRRHDGPDSDNKR